MGASRGRAWLWLAAAALALLAGCGPAPAGEAFALSLLAVGDTGEPPRQRAYGDPGLRVAEALAAEDARQRVDGLVLLGDNFYPDGLRASELKKRLRENVVGRFCRFVTLTPRGRGSLADACPAELAANPVPLYVVLGNHDYDHEGSPSLQRELVPEYVESWRMPSGAAQAYELGSGVSLVLVDSNPPAIEGAAAEVARALAGSRGPWRIVAAHHPIAPTDEERDLAYERLMLRALERSGVPVQLFLAGHDHNLQAFAGEPPSAALHVVAGSGSDVRSLPAKRGAARKRLFGAESLGFARVDLRAGPEPRLLVTLVEVAQSPWPRRSRPAARFEVSLDGAVRAVPAHP
jgi:hypothetical protein